MPALPYRSENKDRPMKALALGLVVAALAACAPAAAHEYKLGDLTIGHPWSRPAGAGMTGVGYLKVTNAGKTADTLVAVETPVSAQVDIHEGSVVGGVMKMAKLPNGLAIPAGGQAALQPGGDHLMMLKLGQPLKAGDKIPATLVFKRAGRIDVSFSVQAMPPAAKPALDHHH
jgi:copper(I)-binding protein